MNEIPVKLNQTYTVEIEGLTGTGEGIAKVDGFIVFVNKAVPGDTVKIVITRVKSNYATADVVEYVKKSSERKQSNICPYNDLCGGCSYGTLNYESQLKIKEKTVKDALERIGSLKDVSIFPIIGSRETAYRNKAQFKVNSNGLGFYQKGTHNIINLDHCQIQQDSINEIIGILDQLIRKYRISIYNEETHKGRLRGLVVRSNRKGELLIVFVINGKSLPNQEQIVEKLKAQKNITGIYLNINKTRGNAILGEKTIELFKRKDLIENLGDKSFKISPTSFFQVNSEQAKVLYDVVKDFADLKDNDTILDLYCGTGSIGIYIASENNNLIGIELNPEAIKDAKFNAKLNNLTRTRFYAGKVEEVFPKIRNEKQRDSNGVFHTLSEKPSCIILDPPRKGCDKTLLDFILTLDVKKIVYVSCNPATLANDLKILNQKYNVVKVQPVDLFPQTGHVETVCLLTIKKGQ